MRNVILSAAKNLACWRGSPILRCAGLAIFFVTLVNGCTHPSVANNKLRDDNQKLREQITDLERRHAGDDATIKALEQKQGTPPEVSTSKVDQLFTVHGIKLNRATGSDGADGLKVVFDPIDEQGDTIKAAGSIVVDAFDLAAGPGAQIGHWAFDIPEARKNWLSGPFLNSYVIKCPWQKQPAHKELTVRVTFTDALTGRAFTEQKVVKLESLPTTQSTSTQPLPRS